MKKKKNYQFESPLFGETIKSSCYFDILAEAINVGKLYNSGTGFIDCDGNKISIEADNTTIVEVISHKWDDVTKEQTTKIIIKEI